MIAERKRRREAPTRHFRFENLDLSTGSDVATEIFHLPHDE